MNLSKEKNNEIIARQLKSLTQSFIPDLNFSTQEANYSLTNNPKNWQSDQQVVIDLYQRIQQSTPEADNSYWLTRTCTLLCWQPIYTAFVSIYGLNHVPDFNAFKQGRTGTEMHGICFLSNTLFTGKTEHLIQRVGKALGQCFEYYRQLLDDAYRCRPHYMQALLGDMLLTALLALKEHSPLPLSTSYILQQSNPWLDAFELPPPPSGSFKITPDSEEIFYTRKSCCFVYKKTNGKLCHNCPRL